MTGDALGHLAQLMFGRHADGLLKLKHTKPC
jgi:hypothetical protein